MSVSPHESSSPALDTFRNIILWRRKKVSATVLLVTTSTWILLQLYEFNFITVASWVAIFIVASLFMWGNVLRLLGKEPPNLSDLKIPDHTALEIANTVGTLIEQVIKWMFHITVEEDWFVFARTVAGLLLLSCVGSFVDLLTLLFIGVIVVMTVPLIYVKYGEQIRRFEEIVRAQLRKFSDMFDEKVTRKMKIKIFIDKEKKVE